MDKVKFEYEMYVSAAQEKLWDALFDPKMTEKYWQHENISDWKPGSKWTHKGTDNEKSIDLVGTVVEYSKPSRLVITWADPQDENNKEKHSTVTITIQPYRGVSKIKVTHENLESGSEMLKGITDGWPIVVSSLKTLMETGNALPKLWGQ